MRPKRRRPRGSGFGEGGGTNVDEYIGLVERVGQAERQFQAGERIIVVRFDQIDRSPYQTRVDFDSADLDALAEDIKAIGLSQPVTLRTKVDGRYELVAGERRCRAVQLAGLETVEARIRELDDFDAHLIGVSENNQRANLSAWEKSVEALELQQHAKAAGRPHAQRDLARYLNRNVAIINQQLAIASAITTDALDRAKLNARDVCKLPLETLHRIAKREPNERLHALVAAVGMHHARRAPQPAESVEALQKRDRTSQHEQVENATPVQVVERLDRRTSFWERGGFQVHIRKPFRDLDPAKAESYIQDLLPGISALAARAAQANGRNPVVRWEHEHGRLLFIPPPDQLDAGERRAVREALTLMIDDLNSAPQPIA